MKIKCWITASVFVFLATSCIAKENAATKAIDIKDLEGKWKVISTTWGGDPKDFLDAIYEIKIDANSISIGEPDSFSSPTEFIAVVNSEGASFGFDNMTFCVTRYANLPESFQFYWNYPMLMFYWRLNNYPCIAKETEDESKSERKNPTIGLGGRYLLRFNLKTPIEAHAIVYYEIGGYTVISETKVTNEIKKKYFDFFGLGLDIKLKCSKGICYAGYTLGTGIFELELRKM